MHCCLNWIMLVFLLFVSQVAAANGKQDRSAAKPFLTIKLIDEAGKPVEGAQSGMMSQVNCSDRKQGRDWNFGHYAVRSDEQGIIRYLHPDKYFGTVFVRHAERRLVAVSRVDVSQVKQMPVVLTMYPECHVTWKLKSSQLKEVGKQMSPIRGHAALEDLSCMFCNSSGSTLHFYLPPGKYTLFGAGEYICPVEKSIEIKAGQTEFDAGTTDTAAMKWILLTGKPAPEIVDVQEWKNGPVKLSQLRGKVVILEFWGWWCGPCVIHGVPQLFKLREEYSQDDLAIIGIHTPRSEDDEVDSVRALDEKLAKVREQVWKGKQIDFPVALTRKRKLPYSPGGEPFALSKMCVEYGIELFPTTIVIDRQGNVFGKLTLGAKTDCEKLKQLIESK